MTCVVGIVGPNCSVIGADSAGVDGHYGRVIRADQKCFKVGEYLFGFTSSFRMGQLLRYSVKPPVPREGADLMEFMCTEFVESIRQTMKTGGYAETVNGRDSGGTFLVIFRHRLFRVESDFQVGEPAAKFDAIGAGGDIALGSLVETRKSIILHPRDRVSMALEASSEFCCAVHGPFNVVTMDIT